MRPREPRGPYHSEAGMNKIKLYTTPTCPYCVAAKQLLGKKGYDYEDIDVARNPQLRAEVSKAQNGYPTVPMIFIGDEFIGGYQQLAGLDARGELDRKVTGQ